MSAIDERLKKQLEGLKMLRVLELYGWGYSGPDYSGNGAGDQRREPFVGPRFHEQRFINESLDELTS